MEPNVDNIEYEICKEIAYRRLITISEYPDSKQDKGTLSLILHMAMGKCCNQGRLNLWKKCIIEAVKDANDFQFIENDEAMLIKYFDIDNKFHINAISKEYLENN